MGHFSLLGGYHRVRLLQISRNASGLDHFHRNTGNKSSRPPRMRGISVILVVAIEFGFFNYRFSRNLFLRHFSILGGCHRVRLLQISWKALELDHFRRKTGKEIRVGRPEPKKDSSRPTRTETIRVGRPELEKDSSRRPELEKDSSRPTRTNPVSHKSLTFICAKKVGEGGGGDTL